MIQIGQQAGGYEFLSLLGCSRIGTAYKVRNLVADRIEILRVLDKELQQDREHAERFLREIKVHARLSHPNLVAFYTATEIEGQLVMTSEFFEGVALQRRLDQGHMRVEEAVACMSQVLAALEYAHEHGVVHREVSPTNILIGPDGTTKLTGFGLAKSAADPQLTQTGTVMGWLEYMSPEQVKGVAMPDPRTDIYSASAVLYEMVTGQVPFICNSEFELMSAHLKTVPAPPSSFNADLPRELNSIILTALAKDPADRFQTAGQFAAALGHAVEPPEWVPVTPPPARWETPRLVITGVLAFLVVAIVFFIFLNKLQLS